MSLPPFIKKIHEWWIYYLLRARFYSIRAVLCLFSCSNFHVIHACLLLVVWMLHNSWLHYSHKASSPMMIRWISLKMLVGLCSNQVTPGVIKCGFPRSMWDLGSHIEQCPVRCRTSWCHATLGLVVFYLFQFFLLAFEKLESWFTRK